RLRREDIPLLADYFVTKYAAKCQRRIKGVTAAARSCLERYDWPGNVRELESAIQRAVVMAATEFITPEDLPDDVLESEAADAGAPTTPAPEDQKAVTAAIAPAPRDPHPGRGGDEAANYKAHQQASR